MRNKILATLFAVTLLPSVALAELTYIGSSTVGTGVLKEGGAAAAFEKKTGKKFTSIEIPGSGKGLQALMDGKTDLAGASRPLKAEEKKAGLVATTIGYDAVAVFVHKSNPVKNLSKEQLKGIFTGKITNWKEVGGKNAPIVPNTEIIAGKRATIEIFQEKIMDGAQYGKFKEIDLPRDQIIDLAKQENGICSVSMGLLASLSAEDKGKVKTITVADNEPSDKNIQSGAYIISRPLLLATKGLPKGDVKEFISFILSPEGQATVEKNFVSVKKK